MEIFSLCCCVNTSSECNEQKQIKAETPKLEPRLDINISISSSWCFFCIICLVHKSNILLICYKTTETLTFKDIIYFLSWHFYKLLIIGHWFVIFKRLMQHKKTFVFTLNTFIQRVCVFVKLPVYGYKQYLKRILCYCQGKNILYSSLNTHWPLVTIAGHLITLYGVRWHNETYY